MIRALYTGTSGMRVQQHKVDSIGNNIANSQTVGYKRSRPDFKEALYNIIENRPEEAGPNPSVGNGTLVGSVQTHFTQGALHPTNVSLDLALDGPGFLTVESDDGEYLYTRDGSLRLSHLPGGGTRLDNGDGYPVLDQYGQFFVFDSGTREEDISITEYGDVYLNDQDGNATYGGRLGIYGFSDPNGLERINGSYFMANDDSGEPVGSMETKVFQGYLEQSNVDMAREMTDLIIAQRAYQLNSRVVQTADEMEKQANSLRG
ncbi:MAG TPA: flagellar hook-basal body protein [Clostridia bacterium]|nr:flagellar hook-basal body protein [Clostridia bacterium]